MSSGYSVIERTPTVDEYNQVRESAGLSVKDEVAAEQGLAHTLYGICIEYEGAVVGIGRVIGDGGLFFDVVDLAVAEGHWGKGVGKLIMDALMSYVDAYARPSSLICLMAHRGISEFYETYGFKARDPDMLGMMIRK
jgi:GNAT superfamily N-acetyltransferase